jgi:hypothetical protein
MIKQLMGCACVCTGLVMEPICDPDIVGPERSYCFQTCADAEPQPERRRDESTVKPIQPIPPIGAGPCELVYMEIDGFYQWVNVCD